MGLHRLRSRELCVGSLLLILPRKTLCILGLLSVALVGLNHLRILHSTVDLVQFLTNILSLFTHTDRVVELSAMVLLDQRALKLFTQPLRDREIFIYLWQRRNRPIRFQSCV